MDKKQLIILVVGSGGREHALVWKLAQSKKVKKIFCAPGNAGTSLFAQNIPIDSTDIKGLANFVRKEKIHLTFVGPEAPLIDGIVDKFRKNKLAIIGPTRKAARIEGSKVFAKKLMAKYSIPTAKFRVFTDFKKAVSFVKSSKYPLVIKADGQCLGKGVMVAENYKVANKFLKKLLIDKIFGMSGEKVVIEECLTGQEVSFMAVTDGKNFVSFLPSQDHKRAFDFDLGPNTGGLGAYSPVPYLNKKLQKRIEEIIIAPTIQALRQEKCLFQGILYPGLILTTDGPKVLEFNCRFGDPETQPVLFLLKTDLIDVFEAILKKQIYKLKLSWAKGFALCVVIASKDYPGKYEKGKIIHFARATLTKGVVVFHSGTKNIGDKIVTSGGRVLGITARGKTLKIAIKNAYQAISKKDVHFQNMHYRHDIGQKGLNKKLWQTA
ncbi:phosphoribosylamine--glycine ligase [Candidatus Gottesmanbacteria bacterium RBG_16_37_8]|uniref:Phosphoribosylamine--glycine ligase n=1 Tax=Candidatus Gottesmanbacteria bacterium RBG_16_37_8 TaxID=1798371 RepID=A0A1F5YWC8_9BACT|nr:MAG: phosphoribosylamine--glycine ligase [Candidatus Gottesmanbacteria bacterium RBG_16_37_8]